MPEGTCPGVGELVGKRYEVDKQLGEGGMGTVFRARHRLTGRRVAIKWVPDADATTRKRLLREARSMGRLSHPNVVAVLDAGEQGDAVYLVMECLEGKNLRAFVGRHALEPGEAVDLLMPAFAGVAAAHQAAILHRDLKPENLFVCTDRDGSAYDTKVLDFGVAKVLSADTQDTSLTHRGMIVGTPKYMAPEQISPEPRLDERTDVYALGLILYEMLAGRLPYASTGLRKMVSEIEAGNLAPLRSQRADLPEALCDVVMRALATDPNDRFADVAEFAQALEPFAASRKFEPPRQAHTPDGNATLSEIADSELWGRLESKLDATAARPGRPSPPAPANSTQPELSVEAARMTTRPAPQRPTPRPSRSKPFVLAAVALVGALVLSAWALTRDHGEAPATSQQDDGVSDDAPAAKASAAATDAREPSTVRTNEPAQGSTPPPIEPAQPQVAPPAPADANDRAPAPTPRPTPRKAASGVKVRGGVLRAEDF